MRRIVMRSSGPRSEALVNGLAPLLA